MRLTFPAGWNLVSFPAGTNHSNVQGPLYTLQAGDTSYEVIQPSQGTKNGVDCWVYLAAPTSITLGAGTTVARRAAAARVATLYV
jgi:hypothetical protein